MSPKAPARGLSRHLEGWQPALLAIFLAGSAAIIAVPRPVDPTFLPVPLADARALSRAVAEDEARADAATSEPLDVDVRKLGSAVRAFGAAEAAGDDDDLVKARSALVSAAGLALVQGEESVLRLRAVELRLFLAEVRRWEATGEETTDLRELGGAFMNMLRRRAWIEDGSASAADSKRRRVLMSKNALRAAWKRRWNEITAIERPAFEPSIDEHRAFYRFVLERPMGRRDAALSPADQAAFEDQYRLKKIDELAAIDPSYPKDLARGIVLHRLGRYLPAVEALRRHLDASPDGPFTLRARSYLAAALTRANEKDGDLSADGP